MEIKARHCARAPGWAGSCLDSFSRGPAGLGRALISFPRRPAGLGRAWFFFAGAGRAGSRLVFLFRGGRPGWVAPGSFSGWPKETMRDEIKILYRRGGGLGKFSTEV